jgi:hypothetical protein
VALEAPQFAELFYVQCLDQLVCSPPHLGIITPVGGLDHCITSHLANGLQRLARRLALLEVVVAQLLDEPLDFGGGRRRRGLFGVFPSENCAQEHGRTGEREKGTTQTAHDGFLREYPPGSRQRPDDTCHAGACRVPSRMKPPA